MTDKNTTQGPPKTPQAKTQQAQQQASSGQGGLQQRYGTIGIEAVAAAVRYSNPGKQEAEPVKTPRIDQRFEQMG